jgi:hypothetical protein
MHAVGNECMSSEEQHAGNNFPKNMVSEIRRKNHEEHVA